MIRYYKVSRGTLREALRLLEVHGLVVMKSGPSGGPVLGKPDSLYLGRILTLFLKLTGATYEHVASALIVLDPIIMRLAAEQRDPQAAKVLLGAIANEACGLSSKQTHTSRVAAEQLTDFHGAARSICGNPILALLSSAISSIFLRHIVAVGDASPLLAHSHEDHLRIAESIISGDADEAAARASDHIRRLVKFHRAQVPGIFTQPVQWR